MCDLPTVTELRYIVSGTCSLFILDAYYIPSNVPSSEKSAIMKLTFLSDHKATTNKCIICVCVLGGGGE